jgi:hypothetical protein
VLWYIFQSISAISARLIFETLPFSSRPRMTSSTPMAASFKMTLPGQQTPQSRRQGGCRNAIAAGA